MARRGRFYGAVSGGTAAILSLALFWPVSWSSGAQAPAPLPQPAAQPVPRGAAGLEGPPVLPPRHVRRLAATRVRSNPAQRPFSPEQVIGPPDVPNGGDSMNAWASQSTDDQLEWLRCSYEAPVQIKAVIVYETYHPGALTKVSVKNPKGEDEAVWEGVDPSPRNRPRGVSVIPINVKFPVQQVKLDFDSPTVQGFNEIDAVGIEDAAGEIHWATKVEASSTYAGAGMPGQQQMGRRPYGPEQATGAPDTPRPGDQHTGWAPAQPDSQPEWLVMSYKKPQQNVEIVVYENCSPGAITKVSVFQKDGKEVTVWEGVDPTPRDQQWGISVFPANVDFPFQRLKLYINCQDVPGYNEIDAVGLRDKDGKVQWASSADCSTWYGMPQIMPNQVPQGVVIRNPDGRVIVGNGPAQPDENVVEIKKELKGLREQITELQKLRQDLTELKSLLRKDSTPAAAPAPGPAPAPAPASKDKPK